MDESNGKIKRIRKDSAKKIEKWSRKEEAFPLTSVNTLESNPVIIGTETVAKTSQILPLQSTDQETAYA